MNIAIIGAGAAGCFAAANIEGDNVSVSVFEKQSKALQKVKVSGGGRCNVTTGIRDVRTVLTKYPRGGKFLTSALHQLCLAVVFRP